MRGKKGHLHKVLADLPAVYCCTWWGVWEDGPGQISCPAAGSDPQAGRAPAGRTSPSWGSVSAAPRGGRGPGFGGKCLSLYGGS